jgi:TPR repeat protein
MRTSNQLAFGIAVALMMLGPVAISADDPPPYVSATEAYRQGVVALKGRRMVVALPALEYAAKRGVLGAQLKLARLYAAGRELPKDEAKAFSYFQEIADQYADISPSSPIAKYVGESLVALGQYYMTGIPAVPVPANPTYAADIYRHAASYFGDAEAQYQLGRLYLTGEGVEKNPSLAVNWLATAAKKQHASAQATLGELLWKGDEVRQRQARGLALLTLAHENAKADGDEPKWIADLYQDAFAKADNATRKEAELLLPELGPAAKMPGLGNGPDEHMVIQAPQGALARPAGTQPTAAAVPAPARPSAPPPAPIGLSVGFGAQPSQP